MWGGGLGWEMMRCDGVKGGLINGKVDQETQGCWGLDLGLYECLIECRMVMGRGVDGGWMVDVDGFCGERVGVWCCGREPVDDCGGMNWSRLIGRVKYQVVVGVDGRKEGF